MSLYTWKELVCNVYIFMVEMIIFSFISLKSLIFHMYLLLLMNFVDDKSIKIILYKFF